MLKHTETETVQKMRARVRLARMRARRYQLGDTGPNCPYGCGPFPEGDYRETACQSCGVCREQVIDTWKEQK